MNMGSVVIAGVRVRTVMDGNGRAVISILVYQRAVGPGVLIVAVSSHDLQTIQSLSISLRPICVCTGTFLNRTTS